MKKLIIILIIVVIIVISSLYYFNINKLNDIKNIYINDNNKIVLELLNDDQTSCYIGNNLNNVKWVKSNANTCILDYKEDEYIYLKNKYNKIKKINNKKLVKILDLEIENKEVYLAIGGSEKIKHSYKILGSTHEEVKFISLDRSIATVDNDGVIIGKSNGETFVKVNYFDKEEKVKVVVTDKIVTHKEEFDYNKKYLECGIYSKEDNNLLDKILENRINNAGYKTRAGVVAAARFIALEFPYRLNYFSENGRLHPYGAGAKIDGEGRYYHKGLYLHDSRFDLIGPKMYGPATWGCQIYSFPSEGMRRNGFDCSGFISWIIYNGGFECEDLGAGVSTIPDMTDLGDRILLSKSIQNKSIRAGDLLSGDFAEGGHIALVAGIKDNNYYVAESLWFGGTLNGAQIRKYTPSELLNNFYWHVDMDKYYIDDGNYTDFWQY